MDLIFGGLIRAASFLGSVFALLVTVLGGMFQLVDGIVTFFAGLFNPLIDPLTGLALVADFFRVTFLSVAHALLTFADFITGGFIAGLGEAINFIDNQLRSDPLGVDDADSVLGSAGALEGLADGLRGTTDGLDELLKATDGLRFGFEDEGDVLDEVNEKLSNVPDGFKTALRQFQAIVPDGTQEINPNGNGDGGFGPGVGPAISIETVTVVAQNPGDFLREMEALSGKKARERGGRLQFNRGGF